MGKIAKKPWRWRKPAEPEHKQTTWIDATTKWEKVEEYRYLFGFRSVIDFQIPI
jgi:hypothetical protein